MSNPATRLITLLLLLQRSPNQKAADLAAQLGISVRSLHRYFAMLEDMGIPLTSERGPNGGFSLVRGYRMPPLVFTPEEAVALSLGVSVVEELWGKLYQEAARGALAKIESVLPEEQRSEAAWARRSLLAIELHRAGQARLIPLLEQLRRAVRERLQVRLVYASRNQQSVPKLPAPELTVSERERIVDPYALVLRWGWWYLVGYCHMRQAVRSFRVDRILELTLLETSFSTPEAFDLRAFLSDWYKDQPQVRARLRFIPEAAHIVVEYGAGWEDVKHLQDGSVEASLAAPDLLWAASTVLSFANWVEVLDPPELREMVAGMAESILARYRATKNDDQEGRD